MIKDGKREYTGLAIFVGVLILAAVLRCFFGVEKTDEAMYIAESAAVADGDIPYVTNWFHSSGYTVAAAPFIKFYKSITGGYEGIFLFTRIMYTVVKLAFLAWGVFVVKQIYSFRTAILFLSPLILFAPYSISNFSYNTIPFLLEILAACYMMKLLKGGDGKDAVWTAVLVACATFLNPTNIIMAVWWLVVLIIFGVRKVISVNCIWKYIVTGLGAAFFMCLILSLLAGGVSVLIEGLVSATKYNPYYYHKGATVASQWTYMKAMLFGVFVCGIVYLACFFVFVRKKNDKKKWIVQTGAAVFVLVICVYYRRNASYIMRALLGGLFFVPLILCVIQKKADKKLLFVWWLPSILNLVISAATAYYGISDRAYLLLPGVLSVTLLLEEEADQDYRSRFNCFSVALSFGLFCSLFGYTYRDVNLWQSHSRVESGIYKGIFTSEDNNLYLTELEAKVKQVTEPQDYVYTQQSFPALYLMMEGKILAPTSWDAFIFWDVPYTGNDYVCKYFEFVNKEPDVILYHYIGIGERVDMQKNEYPFCTFINENYRETEGFKELPELKVYRRK